eukprot:scaffold8374_cov175-Amphora_coffeaeformis.AAC.23
MAMAFSATTYVASASYAGSIETPDGQGVTKKPHNLTAMNADRTMAGRGVWYQSRVSHPSKGTFFGALCFP